MSAQKRRAADTALHEPCYNSGTCCRRGAFCRACATPRVLTPPYAKDGVCMEPPAPPTVSFIVKIWIEETADESGAVVWRGRITHVPSGEQRYIRDLATIARFIKPYLRQMGVESGLRRRLIRWLR